MFDAYLFDLDGTLINSLPLYREAFAAVMTPYGVEVTDRSWQDGVRQSWGMHDWVRHYQLAVDTEDLIRAKNELYFQWLSERLEPMPGAEKFLINLLKQQSVLGLVSHSRRICIDQAIRQLGWDNVFQVIIGSDDVQHRKPAPEGYLLAADKLTVLPERCLVIEDSPAGLEAGKAAGMKCLIVPDPGLGFKNEDYPGADLIVERLDEVDEKRLVLIAGSKAS